MKDVSDLEKAAIKQHVLGLIKRLDYGKGIDTGDLVELLVYTPLSDLLDEGIIYEPIMGIIKVIE